MKQKAKELVDRFKPHAHFWVHDLGRQKDYDEEQLENAKQCALICVDEKIKLLEKISAVMRVEDYIQWEYKLNNEKQEIEKL